MIRFLVSSALLLLPVAANTPEPVVCDCPCAPDDSPLCEPDLFALTPLKARSKTEIKESTGLKGYYYFPVQSIEECACGFICQCEDRSFNISGFENDVFKTSNGFQEIGDGDGNRMLQETPERELGKGKAIKKGLTYAGWIITIAWDWIFDDDCDCECDCDDCCSPPPPGAFGDPHFRTWYGDRFSYHGECDLVAAHSDTFGGGLGFDLHLRTAITDHFSAITNAAVRIGHDTVEVSNDSYWINGIENTELPFKLSSGYTVSYIPRREEFVNKFPIIRISLDEDTDARLDIGFMRKALSVMAHGPLDLGDSVGLFGEFDTGRMLGRDGVTEYDTDSVNDYGAEWQVLPTEHNLFQDEGEVQLPHQVCILPVETTTTRRLRAKNDPDFVRSAENACAAQHAHEDDFDNCMFDVLTTGDIDMAYVF